MIGVGTIGSVGSAARRRDAPVAPPADFSLSNSAAVTAWASVEIGNLLPSDAPTGAYFVLVDEPAGLAVVNG